MAIFWTQTHGNVVEMSNEVIIANLLRVCQRKNFENQSTYGEATSNGARGSFHIYLSAPKAVAGYGFHRRLSVCLSICLSARCLKNRCSQDHQTWHRNVPPWVLHGNPFTLGSKGHSSRSRGTKTVPTWAFALLRLLASSSYYVLWFQLFWLTV